MEAFQTLTTKHADLFDEDKVDRVWYETLEKVDRFLSDNGKLVADRMEAF
jgi:ribosomal protein S18